MAGIRMNTPWIKQLDETAKSLYETFRQVSNISQGSKLKPWALISTEDQYEFAADVGDVLSTQARKPTLNMQALFSNVYSANLMYVCGKEKYHDFRFHLGRRMGIWGDFYVGFRKNKVLMKPVYSLNIQWVLGKEEVTPRLQMEAEDGAKIVLNGYAEISDHKHLEWTESLLHETREYMDYYGYMNPKNWQ